MYETCKKEGIPLNIKTYNLLIRNLPLMKINDLDKLTTLTAFLNEINDKRLTPDSETLAACIHVSGMKSGKGKEFMSLLISEFRNINIQPTLEVYANLLRYVYFRRKLSKMEKLTITLFILCEKINFKHLLFLQQKPPS